MVSLQPDLNILSPVQTQQLAGLRTQPPANHGWRLGAGMSAAKISKEDVMLFFVFTHIRDKG